MSAVSLRNVADTHLCELRGPSLLLPSSAFNSQEFLRSALTMCRGRDDRLYGRLPKTFTFTHISSSPEYESIRVIISNSQPRIVLGSIPDPRRGYAYRLFTNNCTTFANHPVLC